MIVFLCILLKSLVLLLASRSVLADCARSISASVGIDQI